MNNSPIFEYFEALERLRSDDPKVVSKGTRINNDSVSQEAGRKKGSIKKSRVIFADLIVAINIAAEDQIRKTNAKSVLINKFRESSEYYREKWEAAISREISLLLQIYDLKQKLRSLNNGSVFPIRPKGSKQNQ